MINEAAYRSVLDECNRSGATLVAVSKSKPASDILALYDLGQRDFGENYVQELVAKATELPKDIRWHFIGHLQSNKVKMIIPFVQLIHAADSLKLLEEIDKQAEKAERNVSVLLQLHIAQEETKFGLSERGCEELLQHYTGRRARVSGFMGMASNVEDAAQIRREFQQLKAFKDASATNNPRPEILSMGMSSDYKIALEEGSDMIRIGSLFFGSR